MSKKTPTQEERDEIAEDTQAGRALIAVKSMNNRRNLAIIISAAEARDNHLSNLESDERRKRLWAKFSHVRKGDSVFVHAKPQGKNEWLWGKQLTVIDVKPRAKLIKVRGDKRGVGVDLTPFMLDAYKVSLEPTAESFSNALNGDDDVVARKVGR